MCLSRLQKRAYPHALIYMWSCAVARPAWYLPQQAVVPPDYFTN
jgi:hypothetical protein